MVIGSYMGLRQGCMQIQGTQLSYLSIYHAWYFICYINFNETTMVTILQHHRLADVCLQVQEKHQSWHELIRPIPQRCNMKGINLTL